MYFRVGKALKVCMVFGFGHFLKSFYCMTRKLALQVYQRNFHVYVNHGPWGPYFQAVFYPEKGHNRSKFRFDKVCKVSRMIHMKLFYNRSSLELQLEVCRIWAYGAPGAQVYKGQWELWDQICVGHILETTGPIFIIKKAKAIWKPLDSRCALAWSFSLNVPWGLKRALGAQILWGYMYMCVWKPLSSNLCWLNGLIIYVDNFVSYAAKRQQSLWGHQVSC